MNSPLSMTSFGRGQFNGTDRRWTVEIRSVNHRFCDIKIKIPRNHSALEEKIKKVVSASLSRGHIEVVITLTSSKDKGAGIITNLTLAREYFAGLNKINDALSLDDPPSLSTIAAFKDVITQQEQVEDQDEVWIEVKEALNVALDGSKVMRVEEGRILKTDLLSRINEITTTVQQIEENIPALLSKKENTLKERLEKLLHGIELDPMRLAQEVAIIADKSDITEELVRLNSHIQQFNSFLNLSEPVGRRLDFLLQEFLREINTIASKINDTSVTHRTVELKNEVEKIREQAANLE